MTLITSDKTFLREIWPHVELHRDPLTGIAQVQDGRSGNGNSCHSNIDETGSVKGMKLNGAWGADDRTVAAFGCIYNVDTLIANDELSLIAADACCCVACATRRLPQVSPEKKPVHKMVDPFDSMLRGLRAKCGFRLNEFARLIDENPSNLSALEQGRRKPWATSRKLNAVAEALNLVEGTDEWVRFMVSARIRGRVSATLADLLCREKYLELLTAVEDWEPTDEEVEQLTMLVINKGLSKEKGCF